MQADDNSRNNFATAVAMEIYHTEHSLDAAGARLSSLLLTLFEGRRTAGVAASVGQLGLERTVTALQGLTAVRRDMVKAHSLFEIEAERQGMTWEMSGLTEPKPKGGDTFLTTEPEAIAA